MFYLLKKNYLLQIFALVAVLVLCGVQIFFNSLETTYLDGCLPCAAALASAAVSHPLLLKISLFLSLLLQMWLLFRYVSMSGFFGGRKYSAQLAPLCPFIGYGHLPTSVLSFDYQSRDPARTESQWRLSGKVSSYNYADFWHYHRTELPV